MVATVAGLVETHLPSSVAKEVATTSKSLRQKHHPPREDHSQSKLRARATPQSAYLASTDSQNRRAMADTSLRILRTLSETKE